MGWNDAWNAINQGFNDTEADTLNLMSDRTQPGSHGGRWKLGSATHSQSTQKMTIDQQMVKTD